MGDASVEAVYVDYSCTGYSLPISTGTCQLAGRHLYLLPAGWLVHVHWSLLVEPLTQHQSGTSTPRILFVGRVIRNQKRHTDKSQP